MGERYENDSHAGRRVHQNVDVLLARKGLKLGELLESMGIKNSAVYYSWFRKERGPTDAQLHRLAEALDVKVGSLTAWVRP